MHTSTLMCSQTWMYTHMCSQAGMGTCLCSQTHMCTCLCSQTLMCAHMCSQTCMCPLNGSSSKSTTLSYTTETTRLAWNKLQDHSMGAAHSLRWTGKQHHQGKPDRWSCKSFLLGPAHALMVGYYADSSELSYTTITFLFFQSSRPQTKVSLHHTKWTAWMCSQTWVRFYV